MTAKIHVGVIGTSWFTDTINSILAGRLPQPNLYDGWKTQQVVDAALAADARRAWVEVA